MRRVVHLLLAFAVLLSGLHLAEAAEPQADFGHAGLYTGMNGALDDCGSTDRGSADVPDASHHHCPVAPDQWFVSTEEDMVPLDAVLFAHSVDTLHSLSQAPPTEPPTA